jgi:hypothetical protein
MGHGAMGSPVERLPVDRLGGREPVRAEPETAQQARRRSVAGSHCLLLLLVFELIRSQASGVAQDELDEVLGGHPSRRGVDCSGDARQDREAGATPRCWAR